LVETLNLKRSLEREKADKLVWFFRGVGTLAGVTVFSAFGFLDYVMYPQHATLFWSMRAVSVLVMLAVWAVLPRLEDWGLKWLQFLCAIPFILAITSIQVMVFVIHDHTSPYWAGLGLMLSALAIGFSFGRTLFVGIIVYLLVGFFGYAFCYYQETASFVPVLQSIFLIGTGAISAFGRWFYDKLEYREYQTREQLHVELTSRAKVIDERTLQLTRLKGLSRQFSPRLISVIEAGELSMDAPAVNRRICVLFIDIKDSTPKTVTLAPEKNQATIDRFMRDVMRVMIKHDLTIDKFVGDGIIGFSNAPLVQSDYLERCLRAGIEICEVLRSAALEYESLWEGEFQYRIGIGEGESAVGFYGSEETIRTYTGIGQAINIANRVNAKAKINSIAVTDNFRKRLAESATSFYDTIDFDSLGKHDLKGFSEPILLWDVKPKN
jgi:class 3 adenylate cyclase